MGGGGDHGDDLAESAGGRGEAMGDGEEDSACVGAIILGSTAIGRMYRYSGCNDKSV